MTDEGRSAFNAEMAAVRETIDTLDAALVDLLAHRQRQIEKAAEIKTRIGWPARIPPRVDEVLARVASRAEEKALDADLTRALWRAIVDWSIDYEERLMKNMADGKTEKP
jgi:isochorismate pyruvate lyase